MDHYVQISLIVLCVTLFVLALLFIPVLYQIWKAAKGMTDILETLSQSLPAIIHNLEGTTAAINETMATVNEQIEGFSSAARKIQRGLDIIGDLQQVFLAAISNPIFKAIRTTAAVSRAIRVFSDVYRSAPKK
jgi:uncharacterized protein YoxC